MWFFRSIFSFGFTFLLHLLGEVYGVQSLVLAIFEFVQALIESAKLQDPVHKGMEDLLYYLIVYMQVGRRRISQRNSISCFSWSVLEEELLRLLWWSEGWVFIFSSFNDARFCVFIWISNFHRSQTSRYKIGQLILINSPRKKMKIHLLMVFGSLHSMFFRWILGWLEKSTYNNHNAWNINSIHLSLLKNEFL